MGHPRGRAGGSSGQDDFFDQHMKTLLVAPSFNAQKQQGAVRAKTAAGPMTVHQLKESTTRSGLALRDKAAVEGTPAAQAGAPERGRGCHAAVLRGVHRGSANFCTQYHNCRASSEGTQSPYRGAGALHQAEAARTRSRDGEEPLPPPPPTAAEPLELQTPRQQPWQARRRTSTWHPARSAKPLVQEYSHNKKHARIVCGTDICLEGPYARQCCRCKRPAESYLDHHCPECKAVVCLDCLMDLRLLLTNFRCPRCGDEAANQEKLQDEIWMINAYRSTHKIFGTIGRTFTEIFDEEWGKTPKSMSGATELAHFADVSAATTGSRRSANPFATGVHADLKPAVPEHATRVPLHWETLAVEFANYSKLSPKDLTPKAVVRTLDGSAPNSQTRVPVDWYQMNREMACYAASHGVTATGTQPAGEGPAPLQSAEAAPALAGQQQRQQRLLAQPPRPAARGGGHGHHSFGGTLPLPPPPPPPLPGLASW